MMVERRHSVEQIAEKPHDHGTERTAGQKNRIGEWLRRIDWFRDYIKPNLFPAVSRRIDSRISLSRVSGRLAV
jgi:hypothetical protein